MANNALVGNQQQQQAGSVTKPASSGKQGNVLPLWGNEKTMNLNPMILTNILSSPYFKVQLYELKTYHEVVDEIYFKVSHIEPWEKGSRKTAGQTGMCGGVRGVGTGGIVSTAFCLLYKLFTLKLTRKQVMGLITHTDSPYIRALGFMYIRYTQPPTDLWDWFEPYLDDEEEMDVKAGGGCVMTIGEMLRSFLTKLEWFSTLFPRIPVPVQKNIDTLLKSRPRSVAKKDGPEETDRHTERRRSRSPRKPESPRRSPVRSRSRSRQRDLYLSSSFDRELERERERQRMEREVKDRSERDKVQSHSSDRGADRRRSRERHRSRSRSRDRKGDRREREKEREKENDKSKKRERDLKEKLSERDRESERSREKRTKEDERKHRDEREKAEKKREDRKDARKDKKHSRSRSRERKHRSRSHSRNPGKRSRSRSKEKSDKHKSEKDKTNKRSRSGSRGRTDEKAKKREHRRSRERSHRRDHSEIKDHISKNSNRSQSLEQDSSADERLKRSRDETF
ncbi:pre-mRNA-splicing factor 38B [Protopterus annectens]|uniref:pre-mRNA-splicing factor 38B n=1 Tax=Protopterus annectens TaxID=7888 RepID=UPI001CFA86C4|nr:pre-mRNA-splicing factor 38B [Protopterus annectens]